MGSSSKMADGLQMLRAELITRIGTELSGASVTQLQNLLRQLAHGRVPAVLAHCPLPEHCPAICARLDHEFGVLETTELERMPDMAAHVASTLRDRLERAQRCAGLISEDQRTQALEQLVAWEGVLARTPDQHLGSLYGVLDVPSQHLAWVVFAELCKLDTLRSTCTMISVVPLDGQAVTVQLFCTDSVHRANGIISPTFLGCRMLGEAYAGWSDWVRLRGTSSVCVQGLVVSADVAPEEVMYDMACRLGMSTTIGPDAQTTWMAARAWAFIWVVKLAKQGCFATIMFIVGTALFGEEYHQQLWGPSCPEQGHKLGVEVSPPEPDSATTEFKANLPASES